MLQLATAAAVMTRAPAARALPAALGAVGVAANVATRPLATSADAKPTKPVTAHDFAVYDDQLRSDADFQKKELPKYSAAASPERVARVVEALKKKKHTVLVADTKAQAIAHLDSLLKPGASYSSGGSTTLVELDIGALLKRRSDVKNLKGLAIEAASKGDHAKQQQLLRQGAAADLFVSSVSAVTEDGVLYGCDLSGTRVNGWLASGHFCAILGSNKIVKDEAEALHRQNVYQWKLESARARYAFKVPGSAVVNEAVINEANPMGPRTTVIVVKEALGF